MGSSTLAHIIAKHRMDFQVDRDEENRTRITQVKNPKGKHIHDVEAFLGDLIVTFEDEEIEEFDASDFRLTAGGD